MGLSVREVRGLRTLTLGDEGWTQQAAQRFAAERCESLLIGAGTFTDLEFVRPLASLRAVSLGAAKVRDLSALFDQTELEELTIGLDVRDLRGLGRLRNLTDASLPFRRGIEELAELPGLRWIAVEEWPHGIDLDILGDQPELRRLSLHLKRTAVISSGWLTRAPRLEEVVLVGGRLSDTGGLAGLGSLGKLRLAGTKVEDLNFAAATSRLRRLDLDDAGDVASLRPLRHHPQLTEIRLLGSTRVLDGDMTPLLDIPGLRMAALGRSWDNYTHTAAELRKRFPG